MNDFLTVRLNGNEISMMKLNGAIIYQKAVEPEPADKRFVTYTFQNYDYEYSEELNVWPWLKKYGESYELGTDWTYTETINGGWTTRTLEYITRMPEMLVFDGWPLISVHIRNLKGIKTLAFNSNYQFRSLTAAPDAWDTSEVTDMRTLFYTYDVTEIPGPVDCSNASSGLYYSETYHAFYSCRLSTLYLKNIYKNCTMTNESKWSIDLRTSSSYTGGVKDECLIDIFNELPDLINDKGLTDTSNIFIGLPHKNNLTDEQKSVALNKGWTIKENAL